jgi:microcystin-dependent protein
MTINMLDLGFNAFINDNTMATATATNVASAESIKSYVDSVAGAVGGGLRSIQTFTSSGTWTKPVGIDLIVVECIGAGGGGAGCNSATSQVATGGGGGAGGYGFSLIDVSGISSETVTIGAGGSGGAAGTNPGATGGTSSFGAHISCTGGEGGISAAAAATDRVASGGSGGSSSSADLNVNGDAGSPGVAPLGGVTGGNGANSKYGAGGKGDARNATGSGVGSPGLGNGSGGGGASSINTTTDRAGGDGTDGICIVYEYSTSVSIPVGNVAPVGAIMSFARTTPPVGFLECDGSAVSRVTYSELFTAIGTTWGAGDGSTTFNLPDLPRHTLVGSGGSGTGELGNAVGDTGGAETVVLAGGNMPAGTPTNTGSSGSINVTNNTGTASYVPQSGTTYSQGAATPVNIIQPSAVVLMCIAYQANVVADATAASQSEMEAATSNTVFSTPGRQQLHPGHPKAWVIYNQNTGPSVVASYNVASVTDSGTGIYTVIWDTDFAGTDYSIVVSTGASGSGNNPLTAGLQSGTRAAGSVGVVTQQLTSTIDLDSNCVCAFGDQ